MYASAAVAYNVLMHHQRSPAIMSGGGAVIRRPQGESWRKLYRGVLEAYRFAAADGAGFKESLSAAHEAASNPTYIPALLAGDILRQLPFPFEREPVYLPSSPEDIVRHVWKYWVEHPRGCGSVPLYELEILCEPYWLRKEGSE